MKKETYYIHHKSLEKMNEFMSEKIQAGLDVVLSNIEYLYIDNQTFAYGVIVFASEDNA